MKTASVSQYAELGRLKDVVFQSDCKAHKELISQLLRLGPETYPDMELFVSPLLLSPIVAIFASRTPSSHPTRSPGLALLPRRLPSGDVGDARIVHPEWIDINLIRRWMRSCQHSHGPACSKSAASEYFSFAGPAWLIDTWNQCITLASSEYTYIALSYVWGSGEHILTAQRANVDQLRQKNSLRNEIYRQRIPNTVKDAIALTEALGGRYLWVDSLCIVQDDEAKKHSELANMHMIYGKASATIIARQGHDAHYGLRGLRGISQPRDFTQEIFTLGRGIRVVKRRWYQPNYKPSKWNSRGWTFQEDFFSSRKIIFDDDCVRWHCNALLCHEESTVQDRGAHGDYQALALLFSGLHPNMASLRSLLQDYNCRDFSYPEDVLKAFWGTAAALTTSFKGGFIGGLPAVFFDIALLWQPHDQMQRRVARDPHSQTYWLPSWSWAGWSGRLDVWTWSQGSEYIRRMRSMDEDETTERVVPLVQWYIQETPDSEALPISQTWYDYRESYLDTDRAAPEGWQRYDNGQNDSTVCNRPLSPSLPVFVDRQPRCFFKRDTHPNDTFWYPIPTHNSSDEWRPMTLASILSCRTRRATLYVAERISSSRPSVSLRDQSRRWVGALQLNQDPSSTLTTSSNRSHPDEQMVELAEISSGYIFESEMECEFDEWTLEERPKPTAKYEFYNVMCVEWHDGIASRKGLGRVFKDAWEQQNLEWVDLKLC